MIFCLDWIEATIKREILNINFVLIKEGEYSTLNLH